MKLGKLIKTLNEMIVNHPGAANVPVRVLIEHEDTQIEKPLDDIGICVSEAKPKYVILMGPGI